MTRICGFKAKTLPPELLPIHTEYYHYGPYGLVFSTDFAKQAAVYSRSRGYDVKISGVYSPEWKTKLNQYGLFKNRMDAHCFTEFYMKTSEPDGWLEEPGREIVILELYRLVED